MEKIVKNLQLILMSIILISTVIAVGIEIKNMFLNQSVTLADLLLMFLYLEVLTSPNPSSYSIPYDGPSKSVFEKWLPFSKDK